ncbi:SWIM zinc finger family protein [Neorhodopirellula pilleata]|uniref:SWIM-type domain-containing protein n=1 Tax=Neorhodopirellula pilleata TaxID=2714738 RepID=A0A5C6A4N9_9BACT|nr:SWIM zinc finger family protein [Neorhodopirellula pilleata]TWT94337.1 hypothetical protein Pla100_39480 [Neorhodopirellula pilleata]
MSYYGRWAPYVPVARRKANGVREAQTRMKKGQSLQPVQIAGTKISKTFWGQAWCEHFEGYRDFSNRLPRGKTYARNGSVCHLEITPGKIFGLVCGSELYDVNIQIDALPAKKWKAIRKDCQHSVLSLIDLMRGKLSEEVIARLTNPKDGLFPIGKEMSLSCDCPDYSRLCKHLAAVMYGVAARLDSQPELLFVLRGVDQSELIADAISTQESDLGLEAASDFEGDDLGAIFGIEMASPAKDLPKKKKAAKKKSVKKKASKKKTSKKKASKKKASKKKSVKKKAAKKKAVKKKALKRKMAKRKVTKSKGVNKRATNTAI